MVSLRIMALPTLLGAHRSHQDSGGSQLGSESRPDLFITYFIYIPPFPLLQEPKAAYIILLLSILSPQQQPCEVGWAESL